MNNAVFKKAIINMIGITGVAALSGALQAASFDCAKAAAPIEKLICSDETTSKLDADLAGAYKAAMEKADNKDALKQQQRAWLKEKRNACKDADCLTQVYQARISELNSGSLVKDMVAKVPASVNQQNNVEVKPLFKLVKGKQYEVCRVFTDYLNSDYYKKGDCEIGNYPVDKRLKGIAYKQANVLDYENFYLQGYNHPRYEKRREIAIKRRKELLRSGNVTAWIGEADIKNIGQKDTFLVTRYYVVKEGVPPQFCENLGAGISKLVGDRIDNSAWGGNGLSEPFIFDGRVFLIGSGGDGDINSYSVLDPVSSELKYYRNNQYYRGEVAIIKVCDIEPKYN